jgi:hypothetical protein
MELVSVRVAAAVFLGLHGLVHVWYVVLSQGWVEIEEQMGWNGHSWLLSGVLEQGTILTLGSALYVLVTIGFVVGAIGLALRSAWWDPAVLAASVLSTLVILVLWDGGLDLLVEKGFLGVLINLGVVGYLLLR